MRTVVLTSEFGSETTQEANVIELLRAVRGYSYKMQEILVLWGSDVAKNGIL
jgi:hypothetical protein